MNNTPQYAHYLRLLGKPFFTVIILFLTLLEASLISLRKLTSRLSLFLVLFLHYTDSLSTQFLSRFYLQKKRLSKPKLPKLPSLPKLNRPHPPIFLLLSLYFLCLFIGLFYYLILYRLPSPKELTSRRQKLTTQILDRHGQLLYKVYQDENRTLVSLDSLPSYTKYAFIAIEDKDFYNHQGFSISGIFRALKRNLTNHSLEGGSTITQQLVKNALLTNERTVIRKLKELVLAVHTELTFDKDTILGMYINEVNFGGPAYGVQEAAQQYFGKNAKDLSLPETAFLAGLPKAPSKYSPFINPVLAINRGRLVLQRMKEQNYLTQDQYLEALDTPLEFISPNIDIKAPHFVMYVKERLVDLLGESLINHGGLIITTTLDINLQKQAESVINSELVKLKNLHVTNGATLITNPQNGEILAMVGSKDYFDIKNDGQVNLTTSLRQPGSSIKPVNYALALENGYTASSIIKDEPITVKSYGSPPWIPKNYDGKFHGNISLRQALANSYNIPAINVLAHNGVEAMANFGTLLGITTWNDPTRYGLSLTLGSLEVTMTDLAQVYGTFANRGISTPLVSVINIENFEGKIIPLPSPNPKTVIKPETAFLISDILSDNGARSAAFGTNSALRVNNFQVAVKTGTSNDLRDNWTIGYTPEFLVATWVGNNDNTPMSRVVSGITGASPMWHQIMYSLLSHSPSNTTFQIPPNIIKIPICASTNTLPCEGCPTRWEYFTKNTQPRFACDPEKFKITPTPQNS